MHGVVVTCGGHPAWGVPTLWGEVSGTSALGAVESPGSPERLDRFEVDGATHITLVTRPEWRDQTRAAATLLRAHDAERHVSVLETDQLPLAVALVARDVNARLATDPALQHSATTQLLEQAGSALWVRSAGRLPHRVPLGLVISSWWRRSGNLETNRGITSPARGDNWLALAEDRQVLHTSGVLPEPARVQVEAAGLTFDAHGEAPSPGACDLAGQSGAVELAWIQQLPEPVLVGQPCDSCGITVASMCPFCHATWGAPLPAERGTR